MHIDTALCIYFTEVKAMRRTGKAAIRYNRLMTILISVFAGFGAVAAAAIVFSAAAAVCDMSDNAVRAMSGIALAAGCYVCAYIAANRRRSRGLITGVICGAAVFMAVMTAGIFTVRVFSASGIIIKLLIVLSSSAIGGIKGVNSEAAFR